MDKNSAEKLIVALDGMNQSEVFHFVDKMPNLKWVKVGLELFISSGPEVVSELRNRGLRVFLDLKFHDIPITLSAACKQAARTGAELITVHACAGIAALKEANLAAVNGAVEVGYNPPTLLAVTVLTSWDSKRFSRELGIKDPIEERVEFLAKLAVQAGVGGCVCSPLELKNLRKLFDEPFKLITPGIRPKGSDLEDQVRVMSPSEALSAGATYLVLGRPITRAVDPAIAFEKICRELEDC